MVINVASVYIKMQPSQKTNLALGIKSHGYKDTPSITIAGLPYLIQYALMAEFTLPCLLNRFTYESAYLIGTTETDYAYLTVLAKHSPLRVHKWKTEDHVQRVTRKTQKTQHTILLMAEMYYNDVERAHNQITRVKQSIESGAVPM